MRDQSGLALVTVLMVVVVLLLLGTALIQSNMLEVTQVQRQEQKTQSHYLARSGLEIGIQYLEQQLAKVKTFNELNLVNSLEDDLSDIGAYKVGFEKIDSIQSVRLTSTGVANGKPQIEEKIVLTVRVEDSVSVDYASTINWFRKDTGETENNQQLTHNFTTSPLKCDNPVILEVDHKMMTDKTHLFEAPAMQFYTTRSDGLLEVSNKDSLTLVTDFVSFDTKIEGKGELILRTIGGKKYGVVYFGDIMYENEKSPIVTKGYYLFEDGTTWEDGELKTGGLLPAPEDVTDRLFDFSKVRQDNYLEIVEGSFEYSAGN